MEGEAPGAARTSGRDFCDGPGLTSEYEASWAAHQQRLLSALPAGVCPVWAEFLGADFQVLERRRPRSHRAQPARPRRRRVARRGVSYDSPSFAVVG